MTTYGRISRIAGDLRSASLGELSHRVVREVSRLTRLVRRRFPAGPMSDEELRRALGSLGAATSYAAWRRQLLMHELPRFIVDPSMRDTIGPLLAEFDPVKRAAPLLKGATILFGRIVPISVPDWHTDPFSGYRWQPRHWTEIPLDGPEGADVRVVWERSRLRDVFLLGRAFWSSGDEQFAREAARRLRSWLDDNPPEIGVNWAMNLEVAVRAIAFIWALAFFADHESFDDLLIWRLTGVLVASARHLMRDLPFTKRCMPGNHVIGDLAGLALIAYFLPDSAETAPWRACALARIADEAECQVGPRGFHVEQAPAYHLFVWELLYLVAAVARRHGANTGRIEAVLARMAEAAAALRRPDGTLPLVGDDDGAVAYDLGDPARRIEAILALLELGGGARCEELIWFRGPTALERPSRRQRAISPVVDSDIGCVLRADGGYYAFMRAGSASRHTHADALGLELWIGGRAAILDAGPGSYNSSSQWRRFFRSTAAHSTVLVDGQDQAVQHRAFRWRTPLPARASIRPDSPSPFAIVGEHGGYARLEVLHRRELRLLPGHGWLVTDRLSGSARHVLEVRWLLGGEIRRDLEKDFQQSVILFDVDGFAVFLLMLPVPDSLLIETGRPDPPSGWHSSRYGEWRPAPCAIARYERTLPFEVTTLIGPAGADAASTVAAVKTALNAL